MRWFRFYTETLDNPKAQRLSGDQFKGWCNLLCLAARNDGVLPPHDEIAFALRLTGQKATALLDALVEATLLDHDDNGLRPHNWNTRQYKSDVSNERVKRHRERKETVTRNVTPKVTETPPDTETESEQIKPNPNGLVKKPTKGTRLANDWRPDSEDRGFCASELGWDDGRIDAVAAEFRDYWHEQPGQRGVKIQWRGTWRNWCRRENRKFVARTASAKPGRPPAGERRSAIYASVADELEPVGTSADGGGRSGFGAAGSNPKPLAIVAPGTRRADGADVSNAADAAEGIAENVAGVVGEVSLGCSETGDGSGDRNPQMGDPAEGGAGDRDGGGGLVLSASADGAGEAHVSNYPAGMGRGGQDADDLLDIPHFLRRQA